MQLDVSPSLTKQIVLGDKNNEAAIGATIVLVSIMEGPQYDMRILVWEVHIETHQVNRFYIY